MFQIEKYHFDAAADFGNCIVIVSNRKIPFSYCILILEIALSLLQIAKYHFYKAMWFWILYCSCFKYQNTIFVWKLYCNCFKYQNTIFMLYPDFGNYVVFASNIKVPFLYRVLILTDTIIFYVYKNYLTMHCIMLQNFDIRKSSRSCILFHSHCPHNCSINFYCYGVTSFVRVRSAD